MIWVYMHNIPLLFQRRVSGVVLNRKPDQKWTGIEVPWHIMIHIMWFSHPAVGATLTHPLFLGFLVSECIISVVATASTSTVLLRFPLFHLLCAVNPAYFQLQKPLSYQNVQLFNDMMAISAFFNSLTYYTLTAFCLNVSQWVPSLTL